MAKPFGVLVCVNRIRPVLKDLSLLLKGHIWHGPESVTEFLSKGLCTSWVAVRVRESGCAARSGVSCNFCQSL